MRRFFRAVLAARRGPGEHENARIRDRQDQAVDRGAGAGGDPPRAAARRQYRRHRARDGWPNPRAWVAASGADRVLDNAELFDTLEAAIADLTFVLATTARAHDQAKPVVSPQEAAALMAPKIAGGESVGVV